jgi:hypothetical protein
LVFLRKWKVWRERERLGERMKNLERETHKKWRLHDEISLVFLFYEKLGERPHNLRERPSRKK